MQDLLSQYTNRFQSNEEMHDYYSNVICWCDNPKCKGEH